MKNLARLSLVIATALSCGAQAAEHRRPASGAVAADPASVSVKLKDWMNARFLEVGRSCFEGFKAKPNKTVIPRNVLDWGVMASNGDKVVTSYDGQSVDTLFTTVYLNNGGTTAPLAGEIGATWPVTLAPILAERYDPARRQHNCVTMLSANAKVDADIGVAGIQAALEGSTKNDSSLTLFAYGGRILSPVVSVLSPSSVTARPKGVSPFAIHLAVWQWYRAHPNQVPNGASGNLGLRGEVEGIATMRLRGLTQESILKGNGDLKTALFFVNAEAGAEGSISTKTTADDARFAVAIWRDSFVPLMSAAGIAANAPAFRQFVPATDNPTEVSSANAFDYAIDLLDVPSAYCDGNFWKQKSVTPTGRQATVALLDVAPVVVAEQQRCRFKLAVTPASTPSDQVEIPFTLETRVPAVSGGSDTVMELPLRSPVTLPDRRANMTFRPAQGQSSIVLPAVSAPDGRSQFTLTYPLKQEGAQRASGVVNGSPDVTMTCGAAQAQSVLLGSGSVVLSTANDVYDLALKIDVPNAIFGDLRQGSSAQCTIDGKLTLRLAGSSATVALTLPSFTITVKREPTPAPPVAAIEAAHRLLG